MTVWLLSSSFFEKVVFGPVDIWLGYTCFVIEAVDQNVVKLQLSLNYRNSEANHFIFAVEM